MFNRIRLYFAFRAYNAANKRYADYRKLPLSQGGWSFAIAKALRNDLVAKEQIVSKLINPSNKISI